MLLFTNLNLVKNFLKDSLFNILEKDEKTLFGEIDSRWGLLEGQFEMNPY